MPNREAITNRLTSSLIVPMTLLPLAALILATGALFHVDALSITGAAMLAAWVPLFYAVGIAMGFSDGDPMAVLTVVVGFLVMMVVGANISQSSIFQPGVLGGVTVGALCTWLFRMVRGVQLPEWLALFSGRRLGPYVGTVGGALIGLLLGWAWPYIVALFAALGSGLYAGGPLNAFLYGSALRLLFPTGLHHLLMQVVDTMAGVYVEPLTGHLVAGEYIRFLAGDPEAGRILSGFFITNGFSTVGAALAMIHAAQPGQRGRVSTIMGGGILTAMVLGVTEAIDTAYIFASPVLLGLHALYSGLASMLAWLLKIRAGGYGLPMLLVNWNQSENALLILPLGLAFTALYYFSFRAVFRWLRPPVLGQIPDLPAREVGIRQDDLSLSVFLDAMGGPGNMLYMDACMTRLRLQVRDPDRVDDDKLMRLGAGGVVRVGGDLVQVVVGTRAPELVDRIRRVMATRAAVVPQADAPPGLRADGGVAGSGPTRVETEQVLFIASPVRGRVVPLDEVPDPVFAGKMAGDGVALEPEDGLVIAPVRGRVVHLFHGGHAVGIVTPEGAELLIHVGIDTVALRGEGFTALVANEEMVETGQVLLRFDPELIRERGKRLVTPVLVSNPGAEIEVLAPPGSEVAAGQPLLRVRLEPGTQRE